jgi:methyltransferase (TIGR00027 family)
MPRTADDSWDIATSVGATAVMVALARARETASDDPLIQDQFAEPLVSTPELEGVREQVAAWWAGDREDEVDFAVGAQQMINYQAVRTHFFDDYFRAAVDGGIRQVVILAAGLDSRAYRLDWPADTTVYEIDQPKVLEFKTGVLEAHGAVPASRRRPVPVDLRDDWPAALAAAGFDRAQPTAWLAEGLLPYLPGDAQDRLFEKFTALSAPGSRIAVEVFGVNSSSNTNRWKRMRERLGLDVNVEALTFHEPDRSDAAGWLTEHGWQVQSVNNRDEMARLGRPVPEDLTDEAVRSTLLRARLGSIQGAQGAKL